MKPYTLKKLKVYSYIIDIDPIVDPKDTYNSLWSIPFLGFLRKAREDYGGNFMNLTVGESHSYATTDNSKVYCWGSSNLFQLGFFDSFSKTHPRECEMSINPHTSNYMLAGNNHTVMWSSLQGRLYSWGDNSYGQLGLGHYSNIKGIIDISHLCIGKQVKQVEVRSDMNAILLEDGSAQVWPFETPDRPDPSPFRIKLSNEKISTISAGLDFFVMTTEAGRAWSMGKTNTYGELGLGDFLPRTSPTLIENLALSGDMAVQVSCGLKHVVMRNQNGKVFTWGWGERGQLGLDSDRNVSFPSKVLFRGNGGYSYQALNIQAGFRCSYALLEERRLFCWGSNGKICKVIVPTEYSDSGNDEIYFKKGDFRPLKVCTTWSRSASITYLVVGDVRYLDSLKHSEKEVIMKQVYGQWEKNYYDSKPQFDKKAAVHLDSNMLSSMERADKRQFVVGKDRAKTPNVLDALKKKADEERIKRDEVENINRDAVLKHMVMLDKEMKKTEKSKKSKSPQKTNLKAPMGSKDTNKSSYNNDSTMRLTADRSNTMRSRTPVNRSNSKIVAHKHGRDITPTPGEIDKAIKEKYTNIEREMRRIMAKNPRDWTEKDQKFVKEAKKMFTK